MGAAGRSKVEREFALESILRQLDADLYAPLL
jgi:hypothetical protein